MHDAKPLELLRAAFERSIAVKRTLLESDELKSLAAMAETIADSIVQGGKLLLCGNGGSAADAQHLAAELLVRLRRDRQPMPALSLALDSSALTACANDYGFDRVFERMFLALHKPQDVLLGISTSGNSPNIVRALIAARKQGVATLGFLGGRGGTARALCDIAFVVPSEDTASIQECHITAGHALLALVEQRVEERR